MANDAEMCHLDFNCSQGKGRGAVSEGCATCRELISTSSDISIFQRMSQKKKGRCSGYGLGKWHFGVVTECVNTAEAYKTFLSSPQRFPILSWELKKKIHIIPNNSQPVRLWNVIKGVMVSPQWDTSGISHHQRALWKLASGSSGQVGLLRTQTTLTTRSNSTRDVY